MSGMSSGNRMNAAAIEMLISKGLSATDILDVARALEKKKDSTNAERQARHRAKRNTVTVTPVTPPNERDNLTPREVSQAEACSPQPRAWALPVGVSLQVWTDLLKNRKLKRLPTTETTWKRFNDDLARVSLQTGIPPPKLIEECTAKGWGAIYDPREKTNERSGKASDGLSSTARAALQVFGP